jgi:zinc transport system substrate-binding protein
MHEGLKDIQSRDIITFHEAFPYFAREFNLKIVAVIEREPGSEPSAKELAETIDIVKKAKVKALFAEPQYPTKAAEAIARESGAKLYTLDPSVTGPMTADAYVAIMEKNLAELRKALNP